MKSVVPSPAFSRSLANHSAAPAAASPRSPRSDIARLPFSLLEQAVECGARFAARARRDVAAKVTRDAPPQVRVRLLARPGHLEGIAPGVSLVLPDASAPALHQVA